MVSELLHKLGREIVKAMQRDINNNTGELSKSITYKVNHDSYSTSMTIKMLEYGQYVDTGTRGTQTGLPNRKKPIKKVGNRWEVIDTISIWARAHGKNEWAVAYSIYKYGTKPHPFVHNFEDIIKRNIEHIKKVLGKDIEEKIYSKLLKTT